MNTKITAAILAGTAIAACGSAAPTRPSPPQAGVRAFPFNFDRPIHEVLSPDCVSWVGPASLDYLRDATHYRAVALVSIDKQADTRWNTPNGQKLTQAEAIAEEKSSQRYTPWLMTGWTMHVVSGHVFSGNVPPSVVAYSIGGTLGQDSMAESGTGCLLAKPQPGHTYLVAFGAEIDRQARSSLVRPVIAELLPYDPTTGLVVTRGGVMKLPSHL